MIELKIAMQGNAHRLRFLVYEDETLLPKSALHIRRSTSYCPGAGRCVPEQWRYDDERGSPWLCASRL